MTIQDDSQTIIPKLSSGIGVTVTDALQAINLGRVVAALPRRLVRASGASGALQAAPAALAHTLSTTVAIQLPDHAKADKIVRVIVLAGTAKGEFTDKGNNVTPTTTTAAISPSGDIVFLASDAPTDVLVSYIPRRAEVREFGDPTTTEASLAVASNAVTIPTSDSAAPAGVVGLYEAEGLAGTASATKLVILAPGASPSAGQCALSYDGTTVNFASADAWTSVRVKYGVIPSDDLDAVLRTNLTF